MVSDVRIHALDLSRMTGAPASSSRFLLQLQRQYGNRHVQRVVNLAGSEREVGPEVQSALERARGGGQALESPVQRQMESVFGVDFREVRVHSDSEAHTLNQAVNAVAFTNGQDIFFRQGAYQPNSSSGRELLAHELTHVLQQSGGNVQGKLVVGPQGDVYEQEAERVAKSVTNTLEHHVTPRGGAQQQESGNLADAKNSAHDAASEVRPGSSLFWLQRQAHSTEQDNLTPSSVSLDEDLFVEDDQNPALPAAGSSAEAVVQRSPDGPDIPPTPPPFPSVFEWAFDVFDDAGSLYGLTCEDRRERGFFVIWNQVNNHSFAGGTAIGGPAVGCSSAHIDLGSKPDDGAPLFPVGWFHTHPPANSGCRKVGVGPSDTDKRTSQRLGLPGMVEDTATPSADCKTSASFFFGPSRRS